MWGVVADRAYDVVVILVAGFTTLFTKLVTLEHVLYVVLAVGLIWFVLLDRDELRRSGFKPPVGRH